MGSFGEGGEGHSMGVATAKWAGHECWSADGLLLPADVFVPLHGSPQVGYRAGPPAPLVELLAQGRGEWVEVDPLCRYRHKARGLLVEAGGGPVEAEGFVAVADAAGGLVWVLHLSDSEAFTAVSVEGGEVVAVAEEYPFRNEFRIPIAEPGRLRVRSEGVAGPPRGG
jgi:hypothetical protein